MLHAIGPNCEHKVTVSAGRKDSRRNDYTSDSFYYDLGKYYAIIPQTPNWKVELHFSFNAKKSVGFHNSGENTEWVSVEELLD